MIADADNRDMFAIAFITGLLILCVLGAVYGVDSRTDERARKVSLVRRRAAQPLQLGLLALVVEAPLAGSGRRGGRPSLAPRACSLGDLIEDPLRGELAVS